MFGFFKRIFQKKDALGFTAYERQIYKYFDFQDGKRITRYGDPMEIARKLKEVCPEWTNYLKNFQLSQKLMSAPLADNLRQIQEGQFLEAVDKLAEACSISFDVKLLHDGPNGPSGLKKTEMLGLLNHFLLYASERGAEALPLPKSPVNTDSQALDSVTKTGSDSGATETTHPRVVPMNS